MINKERIFNYTQNLFPNKVNKRIFFLHLPKCGGTSMVSALQSNYGLAESISQRHFFALGPRALNKSAQILDKDVRILKENLLIYYMSQPRMKLISGHFLYSEKAMEEFGNDWNFITLLRDPVKRWFSNYFMDRYLDSAPTFANIDLELRDFLTTERAKFFARYYVIAFNDEITIQDAASDTAIEQAIENIGKFSLVGALEKLDKFSQDYKQVFGADFNMPKLKTSVVSKQNQKSLITDDIRSKVEEMCEPSIRVYNAIFEKL